MDSSSRCHKRRVPHCRWWRWWSWWTRNCPRRWRWRSRWLPHKCNRSGKWRRNDCRNGIECHTRNGIHSCGRCWWQWWSSSHSRINWRQLTVRNYHCLWRWRRRIFLCRPHCRWIWRWRWRIKWPHHWSKWHHRPRLYGRQYAYS